mmetsp:Transcript_12754/g.27997  ORF Transcript_12754/g.27997 Transcript_12754/m.27997 type:complete len:419 (+) Transcript_12754:118-1374(+)
MVLCCFDSNAANTAEESTYSTTQYGGGAYPGNRLLVKTAGNALMEAPIQSPGTSDLVVAVNVPPGVVPGDTIRVNSPDGRRSVDAMVPANMKAGGTFQVRFPPESTKSNNMAAPSSTPAFAHALDTFIAQETTQQPTSPATQPATPAMAQAQESRQEEMRTASKQQLGGFADSINTMLGSPHSAAQQPATPVAPPSPSLAGQQRFLMVNVPPGTSAGSTLHARVPGENRTLAVTVPPGVSSFRVAYTSKVQSSPGPQHQTTQTPAQDSASYMGQKLLLVQVPPGTTPGATLHVAVPEEPGRILAAQVPANVSQFHVAYEPRSANDSGAPPSMNPAYQQANSKAGMMPLANPYHHQPQQTNQRSSGGVGDYVLPAIGAAALGTAAFATYGHFAHRGGGGDDNFEDSGAVADFGGDGFDN